MINNSGTDHSPPPVIVSGCVDRTPLSLCCFVGFGSTVLVLDGRFCLLLLARARGGNNRFVHVVRLATEKDTLGGLAPVHAAKVTNMSVNMFPIITKTL